MRIAVIGGGASGMTTAYLLDRNGHAVTLYEREAILGGNIRTLNGNVTGPELPSPTLEAGVIEFSANFHRFLALMAELDVDVEPVEVGSALFFRDGRHYLSPHMIQHNTQGLDRLVEQLRFYGIQLGSLGMRLKAAHTPQQQMHEQPLGTFLDEERPGQHWLALLIMYCYSIPYPQVDAVPTDLAINVLRNYMGQGWYRLPGGVYGYIARMLARFGGEVVLDATIGQISRNGSGVQVRERTGTRAFDKLVFATQPDQVLQLLADPTADERRRFGAWQPNFAETLIHTDTSLYARHGIREMSEFDFFETSTGWGYNGYLNKICGLERDTRYFLAFGLDELIDPARVLYRQRHHTPLYTVDALRHREEVLDCNGENHTYHAGAYLADGLHEGAIVSALRVADAIG